MSLWVYVYAGTVYSFFWISFCCIFCRLAMLMYQMSHSLSLDVMEMAGSAALLERLASGLEAAPSRSTVLSSSVKERTDPWDKTCCCSLAKRERQLDKNRTVDAHTRLQLQFKYNGYESTGSKENIFIFSSIILMQ